MKRSLTKSKLIERKSDERNVFEVVNELQFQAGMTPLFRLRGASDGAGTYLTLWSDEVDDGAAVYIEATVIGVGTGNNAWYKIQVGIRNTAGVLSIIGATAVTTTREDAAGSDARITTSGTTVALEVRDDGANPTNWVALVTYLASA